MSLRSFCFLAAIALPFAAQAATVAEIATYKGADRQAMLEEGAKKEGLVQIYTTGTQTQSLFEALGKKYPYIKIELFRAPTIDTTRRALEEQKAGKNVADVFDNSTGGLRPLLDAGLLQSYSTPDLVNYRKEAIEAGGNWVLDFESYMNLGYNTKIIPEAQAPKTYEDLLDPKWKGKMAFSARGSTIPHWTGVVIMNKGEDLVRKIAEQQQVRVFQVSARGLANLIVSGEVPMSLATYSSHIYNSQQKGASVAWRALGPTYAITGATGISSAAPHPHAAMLTIDFLLSKEGQSMRQGLGYSTARLDMQNGAKPDKIEYLTDRPNYLAEYEKWAAFARPLFAKNANPPDGFVDSGED
jgi:iron(III) transport system substrate-binding protein